MKNPWDNFGLDTIFPCEVCGRRPAKLEPRFYYAVCEYHFMMPPVEVSRIGEENG